MPPTILPNDEHLTTVALLYTLVSCKVYFSFTLFILARGHKLKKNAVH